VQEDPGPIVRHASWFGATLLVGVGLAIAVAIPDGEMAQKVFFSGVASSFLYTVLVLARQPSGTIQSTSAALLAAAFVVPLILAHALSGTSACSIPRRAPCDPAVVLSHPSFLLGTLLIVALAGPSWEHPEVTDQPLAAMP
jgi:hypothetical protein